MDEQTVNEADLFEPSDITDQDAEQSENETGPAVEATNEEQTDSQEQTTATSEVSTGNKETQTGDVEELPGFDEFNDKEFLAKKGVDPSKPEDIRKLAYMYANSEKGFNQKSQEKAKLERELANAQPPQSTPDMQALSEVRALKTERAVEKWKQEKNLNPETEQKMMDWFAQPIVNTQTGQPVLDANGNPIIRGYLYANGVITLDDVYNFVGGNAGNDEGKRNAITEELRNEVKKEMSARQAAKSTKQGATNSMQFGNPDEKADPFLEGLGL